MFCGCGAKITCDGIKEGKCSFCQGDGAFRTRLSRALASMKEGRDHSIAVDFTSLSEEDKANFKKEHHDKMGARLKMAIRQQVIITRNTQSMQTAIAKGYMKDEVDLTEKYGNKPEQLAAIKQSAYTSICPIRGVHLWADPEFYTELNFNKIDNTEQLLNLDTNDSDKAAKRQKTEKAPQIEGDTKHMKRTDLAMLKERVGKIANDVNEYRASVEEATNYFFTGFIPAKVTKEMNEKRSEVIGKLTQIEEMIESGRSMYTGTELRKMLSDIKKTTKNQHRYVKCRVATVKSDMAD